MREVADIICSFPNNLPAVVLSAMGKVGHHVFCFSKGLTYGILSLAAYPEQLLAHHQHPCLQKLLNLMLQLDQMMCRAQGHACTVHH
jgi:hypothetical protein